MAGLCRRWQEGLGLQPQADNRIVQGRWWADTDAPPQFSVEEGIAETLGIRIGDQLTYWVAGSELSAPVTSLRKVHWDSFNVNFFVVLLKHLVIQESIKFIKVNYYVVWK